MARNDLVLALVRAGVAGDRDASRRAAEAIVVDERAKQRSALAERLETELKVKPKLTVSAGDDLPGLQIRTPYRTLDSLFLPELTRTLIDEFTEEQIRSDLLRSEGLEPRHTMLMVGQPGTGKTSLAEAIATALGLPIHKVRYDSLVGSYLGETSGRLRRIFEHARTNPCVLFFDEFDAIGKERGDTSDVGELKRVVASLLTQIDEMPTTTVVICASNHPQLLDHAAWRRFELRLSLPMPDVDALDHYFTTFARTLDQPLGLPPADIAEKMRGASYADAEALCDDARRRVVLSLGADSMAAVMRRLLDRREAQAPLRPPLAEATSPKGKPRKALKAQTRPAESSKVKRKPKAAGAARKRTSPRRNAKPSAH
jgi:SpoVK/Ycf46/Vps4 family AAA+-type ATPase